MAAYIQSGQMAKMLLSPKIKVYSEAFNAIEIHADKLQAELDELRGRLRFHDGMGRSPVEPAILDRIRELRRELSAADAKSSSILRRDNPEYFRYWGI